MKGKKATAMIYETGEAKLYKKNFKEYILKEIKEQNWTLPVTKTQHFYCDCVFYFDRIDKDCNNYFKLLLDAITDSGAIWADDNVVCERVHRIYYDSENPRVEITIYPVSYVGIFDNQEQLDAFESNCASCSRYARNCSILNNAKIGRIQSEISDCVCSKYKEGKGKNDR